MARSARLGYAGLNPPTVVAEAEPRLAGLLEPVVVLSDVRGARYPMRTYPLQRDEWRKHVKSDVA